MKVQLLTVVLQTLLVVAAGCLQPQPVDQYAVLLDFDGQQALHIGGQELADFPAFSAQDFGLPADQTPLLENEIQQVVDDVYSSWPTPVQVYCSTEAEVPRPAMTVYLGGSSPNGEWLGLACAAQGKAVVFVDTISAFHDIAWSEPWTVSAAGQVVGNVAAHELGHLLGLDDIPEPGWIMSQSQTMTSLLSNLQQFPGQLETVSRPTSQVLSEVTPSEN
jgi:hypothetical protein